jgi:hypothetical protein
MLHKDYDHKSSVEGVGRTVVVNLKGLGAKMNWSAVNCQMYSNYDSDYDSVIVRVAEAGNWDR